ncbi:hypothetical protein thsrh120_12710 [Rhizobium sp. No.120]
MEIDSVGVSDDAAIYGGNAGKMQIVFDRLFAQPFPAITRAIEIDDIDRNLLSDIISGSGIEEGRETINLFENDYYSCKQKSWRQQLR